MAKEILKLSKYSSINVLNINVLEKHDITAKISTRDFNDPETFLNSIDIDPNSAVSAEQIHSDNIKIITEEHHGMLTTKTAVKGCDALITRSAGIPLLIRTADCLPLFIFDPKKRIIGLAHIGWKGTILKLANKVINKMIKSFKIDPSDCIIATGPCISKDCYEVDPKVIRPLKKEIRDFRSFIKQKKENLWHFDLLGLNIKQLTDAGVRPENIHSSNYCTHCKIDLLYSYRKEGRDTGRIYSVFMLNN